MHNSLLSQTAKRITLLLLAVIAQVSAVMAAPAYPFPIAVKQPDGTTVTIQMHGDEFFGYSTVGNLPVVRQTDGYFYYASYSTNGVQVTDVRVNGPTTKAVPASVQPITPEIANAIREKSQIRQRYNNPLTNAPLTKAANDNIPSFFLTKPLVVIINYRDIKCGKDAKDYFTKFLNQSNFNGTGSVRDYYSNNSMGAYTPEFNVYGPIELENNRNFYGDNSANGNIDVNAHLAFIEVAEALVKQGVRLKDYDQNNDGVLDNLFLIFAGNPESEGAPASAMWPHQGNVSALNRYVGGVKLATYGCTSEYKGASGTSHAGIGTYTHEFGHVLGLRDMYDTDYATNGQGPGLGALSLMAAGNYNNGGNTPPHLNIFERHSLGWAEIPEPQSGITNSLDAVSRSNKGFMLKTNNPDEYYIIENRDFSHSWDKYIDVTYPKGLLVYHVDQSENIILGVAARKLWELNKLNAVAAHQCMRIIPSSGTLNFNNLQETIFPGSRGKTALSSQTTPSMLSWANKEIKFSLTNISIDKNGVASFLALNVDEMVKISGTVTANGTPIAGAQVKLTPIPLNNNTTKANNGLSVLELYGQTKLDPSYTVTDSKGQFTISAATAGQYQMTVAQYQYAPFAKTLQITNQDISENIELTPLSATIEKAVSIANPLFSGYLNGTAENLIGGLRMRWKPSEIVNQKIAGKPINAIYWYNALTNVKAQANIYFDDKCVFSTQILTKPGANMTPVLGNLTVPNNQDLIIEFIFPTKIPGLLVALDQGPAVTGYGDLVNIQGEWRGLKALGLNYNIKIGFSTDKTAQDPSNTQIQIHNLGQYSTGVYFGTTDAAVDKWNFRIQGPDLDKSDFATQGIIFSNLQPDKTYKITASPVIGQNKGEESTIEFKTLPLTAKYPAILAERGQDERYTFSVTNIQEKPTSIEWKLNDNIIDDQFHTSLKLPAGEQTISVRITYNDGLIEIITRKIKAL